MKPVPIAVTNGSTALSPEQFTAICGALRAQALHDYNTSPWVERGITAPVQQIFQGEDNGDFFRASLAPGTWVIELLDTSDQPGAIGYHEDKVFDSRIEGATPEEFSRKSGIRQEDVCSVMPRKASERSSRGLALHPASGDELPVAKVFVKTVQEDGVDPCEVASHEMLEMLVDPLVVNEGDIRKYLNPCTRQWYIAEVGDPVQGEGYRMSLDGPLVANFVWPRWFDQPQRRRRFDQRQTRQAAFELAPGGYMSVAPESEPNAWKQIYGASH